MTGRELGRTARGRDVPAFEALARSVRAELAALVESEAAIRATGSAKAVHDARVALRRMRSRTAQLKGVLARKERERLVRELRWLARRLGPLRDLDTLRARVRGASPRRRADFAPAAGWLAAERERRLAAARAALATDRHARLLVRLERRFAPGAEREFGGRRAQRPFRLVLAPRIEARAAEVRDLASGLGPRPDAPELHALRIAGKRLRYLVECCAGLVVAPLRARVLADLVALQDTLGALQDAEVHARLVARLRADATGAPMRRVRRALACLRAHVVRAERAARGIHARSAEVLTSRACRARFAALLAELRAGPASAASRRPR